MLARSSAAAEATKVGRPKDWPKKGKVYMMVALLPALTQNKLS
jgi:hypothetical protein